MIHLGDVGWFDWAVFVARIATMLLAASFSATMLRYSRHAWSGMIAAERAWITGLIIVSMNLAVYIALIVGNAAVVFPDSLAWVVYVAGYAILWRALILTRPERGQ